MKKLIEIIEKLPKAELHVHADGSVPAEVAFEMWIKKLRNRDYIGRPLSEIPLNIWQERSAPLLLPTNNIQGNSIFTDNDLSRRILSIDELKRYWADWSTYSIPDRFSVVTKLMEDEQGLKSIFREHIKDLARQNIIYVETRFAPQYHTEKKLSIDQVIKYALQGIELGMKEAKEKGYNINSKLIICIGREVEEKIGIDVAEAAIKFKDKGMVALDLACYEPGNPPEKHTAAFDLAKKEGLLATVHAGEMMKSDSANLKNIYTALNDLKADGIGHAIPLWREYYTDGNNKKYNLIDLIKMRNVRIESNPISNQVLENVNPVDLRLWDLMNKGILITINSDDPTMWPNGSLSHNLAKIADIHGENLTEKIELVKQFTINAIKGAFGLSKDEKESYIKQINEAYQKIKIKNLLLMN